MKKLLIALTLICSAILVIGAQTGFAWPTYEGGCINCHGAGFSSPLHTIHAGQACTICHPGAAGALPIPSSSCIACHPPANPGLCPLINDSSAGAAHGQSCLVCHTNCEPPPPPCVDNAECGSLEFCAKAPGDCNGIGQCTLKPEACPDIYDPVCGCDGTTYDNACFANQAGVNIDYAGPCSISCDDGDPCTVDVLDPSSGQCTHTPKQCDDGIFCNGIESCEPTTGNCVAVSACPPSIDGCVIRNNTCDEINDVCVDFADDSKCDDGDPSTIDTCDLATGECKNTPIPQEKACWLTAGGVKFEPLIGQRMATVKSKGDGGPVISIGGNVNPGCSPTAGDGGNWNHIDHQAKLRFQGRQIEIKECGSIPEDIKPPGSDSPKTPFNFIEFQGTGILKGISGNKDDFGTVCFYVRVEDRNEPGSKETLGPEFIDRYWIRIDDCAGTELYRLGNDVADPDTRCGDDSLACTDTISISGGNLQIHESSCDKYY